MEVMKDDGYAGLTVAKVAARAGESKALIAYHFGSKNGLVAAAGSEVAEMITRRVLESIEGASTVEGLVRGVVDRTAEIGAEDPRVPRLYFDLAAVSVVEPEVREAISGINRRWRDVMNERLLATEDGPGPERAAALTHLIVAGTQGLNLERLQTGEGPELDRARDLFVRSVVLAAAEPRG